MMEDYPKITAAQLLDSEDMCESELLKNYPCNYSSVLMESQPIQIERCMRMRNGRVVMVWTRHRIPDGSTDQRRVGSELGMWNRRGSKL